MANPVPNTTTPLVVTPTPPEVGTPIINGLGQLSRLIGNWNSLPSGTFSWNVMPLPQDNAADWFILKNFPYSEEMTFATIPGNAPNRGGGFTQVANTLFYEQRVYFSPANTVPPPQEHMLVHAENGSWLFLDVVNQFPGAFPPDGTPPVPLPDGTTTLPEQDPSLTIAKQMSVPHGNSILATGTVNPAAQFTPNDPVKAPDNPQKPVLPTKPGKPVIPQLNAIPNYQGKPYGTSQYGNSKIVSINGKKVEGNSDINPNIKLEDYISQSTVTDYIHFTVEAKAPRITNIDFETKHSKVNSYKMELWVLNPNGGSPTLMYYQNIGMQLTLVSSSSNEKRVIEFPHITCNVLQKVK
jgi:hypothetical protein